MVRLGSYLPPWSSTICCEGEGFRGIRQERVQDRGRRRNLDKGVRRHENKKHNEEDEVKDMK